MTADRQVAEATGDSADWHPATEGYYRLHGLEYAAGPDIRAAPAAADIMARFLPKAVLAYSQKGEFRPVVSLFISCHPGIGADHSLLTELIGMARQYKGYVDGLFFGDKGLNSLVLFGVPMMPEKYLRLAVEYALTLQGRFPGLLRAGMTVGTVFAGIKGSPLRCCYGVIGDSVNLAARLMAAAPWGSIWCDGSIFRRMSHACNFVPQGERVFKGKADAEAVYALDGQKTQQFPRPFRGRLVGRSREVHRLLDMAAPIFSGRFAGVALLTGEAGIGKSRTVYEFVERMGDMAQSIVVTTDPVLRKSFYPFIRMLVHFFTINDDLSQDASRQRFSTQFGALLQTLQQIPVEKELVEELKRTRSILAALLDISWPGSLYDTLPARARYENTIFALKAFIKALSRLKPLVLVLEDLHWLDVDSQQVVQTLCRLIDDYPLFIVATTRPAKEPLLLDEDVSRQNIELAELLEHDMPEIIQEFIGQAPAPSLCRYIADKTQGNPFYIEHLCLYLKENGCLTLQEGHIHRTGSDAEVPDTINAILMARIDRLSIELQEFAQVASVLGREFDSYVLNAVLKVIHRFMEAYELIGETDRDIGTISSHVTDLGKNLEQGSEQGIWLALSDISYLFRHAMIQDVIYQMQLKSKLRKLHRFAAEAIEGMYTGEKSRYEELAYHYLMGEMTAKARHYLREAAMYAEQQYENERAITHYQRLLPLLTDEREKVGIRFLIAKVYKMVGRWQEAEALLRENIEVCERLGDDRTTAMNKNSLGMLLNDQTRMEEALALYQQALPLLAAGSDNQILHNLMGNMGFAYQCQNKNDQAMKCFLRKLHLAEEIGDMEGMGNALGNIGIIYDLQGQYQKAIQCHKKNLTIAVETGSRHGEGNAWANLGNVYNRQGNLDQAMDCFVRKLAISRQLGDKKGMMIQNDIGVVHARKGDWKQALACFREGRRIAGELGDKGSLANTMGNIANIHIMRSDYEKALTAMLKTKELSEQIGKTRAVSSCLGNIAVCHRHLGHYAQAMHSIQHKLELCSQWDDKSGQVFCYGQIAHIHLDQGDHEQATAFFNKQLGLSRELGEKRGQSLALSGMAEVHTRQKAYHQALACLEQALSLDKEAGMRLTWAEDLHAKAEVLLLAGQPAKAADCLMRSRQIAKRLEDEELLYHNRVLELRIQGKTDTAKAMQGLGELLAAEQDPSRKGFICYYRFLLGKDDMDRLQALEFLRPLYAKKRCFTYKQAIDALTGK